MVPYLLFSERKGGMSPIGLKAHWSCLYAYREQQCFSLTQKAFLPDCENNGAEAIAFLIPSGRQLYPVICSNSCWIWTVSEHSTLKNSVCGTDVLYAFPMHTIQFGSSLLGLKHSMLKDRFLAACHCCALNAKKWPHVPFLNWSQNTTVLSIKNGMLQDKYARLNSIIENNTLKNKYNLYLDKYIF